MVGYRRNYVPGGTYFFTVTLRDRRSRLLLDHIDLLRNCMHDVRLHYPFTIDAMVVLADHLHAIWTLPDGDADFPLRWKMIKREFSCALIAGGIPIDRDARGEVDIWQRRYWEHTIRDDADMQRCVDYIHYDPVKHGYVASPVDWPHSSIHRFIRNGILPADWGGSAASLIDGAFGERD